MSTGTKMLLFSLFLGIAFWVIDALADYHDLYAHSDSFWDLLILDVPFYEALIRFFITVMFLGLGTVTAVALKRRARAEQEREKALQQLEDVYARERKIAETLQRNFLPDAPVSIDGFLLADNYSPALDESAIGGDVYDTFRLPSGRIGIVIADVSGKGLRAAKYSAMVKYMLRAYSYQTEEPEKAMAALNDSICAATDLEAFVTCFFGILDPQTKRLVYANAGHDEPLVIYRERCTVDRLRATGMALGIESGMTYTSRTVDFQPGQIALFYTDGVTEAHGAEKPMDIEGLESFVLSHCNLHAPDLVACVLDEVRRRSGGGLADDVAMLALEVLE